MTELSKEALTEFPRNAAGDVLSIRDLRFIGENSSQTSSGQAEIAFDRNYEVRNNLDTIEIKHPTDLSKFEIKTILSIDSTTITVDSDFANTYPVNSRIYLVLSERDILDSAISDRVEANVQIIEQAGGAD